MDMGVELDSRDEVDMAVETELSCEVVKAVCCMVEGSCCRVIEERCCAGVCEGGVLAAWKGAMFAGSELEEVMLESSVMQAWELAEDCAVMSVDEKQSGWSGGSWERSTRILSLTASAISDHVRKYNGKCRNFGLNLGESPPCFPTPLRCPGDRYP